VNKFIGFVVLLCAFAVGFGSIAGCPKAKEKEKDKAGQTDKDKMPAADKDKAPAADKDKMPPPDKDKAPPPPDKDKAPPPPDKDKAPPPPDKDKAPNKTGLEVRGPEVAMNAPFDGFRSEFGRISRPVLG